MILICSNKKCAKQFERPRWRMGGSENHFCSRSCSATFNNSKAPKRISAPRFCHQCNNTVTKRAKYYDGCIPQRRGNAVFARPKFILEEWEKITFGQLVANNSAAKASRIRELARRKYKSAHLPMSCFICSYKHHIDICHRRPINEFKESDTIATINSIGNLIGLCKNCHWEMDKGLMSVDNLNKIDQELASRISN